MQPPTINLYKENKVKVMTDIKKTSLYDIHKKYNGNMVDFAGTYLPTFYTSIQQEHNSVRNNIGIFDVSHMGNLILNANTKNDALEFLNYLLPNDYSKIFPGKCIYSTMLDHNGCVIDDIIVMSIDENIYHIIVNAANIKKDFNWIKDNINNSKITIENKSYDHSMLAIQGPNTSNFLSESLGLEVNDIKPFNVKKLSYNNNSILVSRTGYTGEDGFEIITNNNDAPILFEEILEKGKALNIIPCGLGARDTLRLEAALPLYGHEFDDKHTPLQTNMAWSVKLNKPSDFIGKQALLKAQNNIDQKLIGIEVEGRAIPRRGMLLLNSDKEQIGEVTSGTFSPTLQKNIGLAYLDTNYLNKNDINIQVRNRSEKIKIVDIPFYKRIKQ